MTDEAQTTQDLYAELLADIEAPLRPVCNKTINCRRAGGCPNCQIGQTRQSPSQIPSQAPTIAPEISLHGQGQNGRGFCNDSLECQRAGGCHGCYHERGLMPLCGRCGTNGCFQCQKPVGFSFERYGWEMEFLWWDGYE